MPYNPSVVDRSGEYLAQGISSAFGSLSRSIETIAAERRTNAREASQLRGLLKTVDPDNAEDFDVMGLSELRQHAAGVAAKRQRVQDQLGEHQLGQVLARQKFVADYTQQVAPPALQGLEPFLGPAVPPQPVDERTLLQSAARAGYAIDPRELQAFLPPGRGLVPGQTVPLPAGKYGIANSASSIQIFDDPTGEVEPKEISIGGKPTGWALFPDGRYRLVHGEDTINAAQFDTDGDGVLSEAEWAKAIMAQRMGGDLVPGMRVDGGKEKPKPEAPAGKSLFEQFKERRR